MVEAILIQHRTEGRVGSKGEVAMFEEIPRIRLVLDSSERMGERCYFNQVIGYNIPHTTDLSLFPVTVLVGPRKQNEKPTEID